MGMVCATETKFYNKKHQNGQRSKSLLINKTSIDNGAFYVDVETQNRKPSNKSLSYRSIKKNISQGNLNGAKISLQEAILMEPDKYFYHYLLGKIQYEEGFFDMAELSLNKAVELKSSDWHSILLLINIHIKNYDYGKALEILKDGLEVEPDNIDILLIGALLNELTENFEISNQIYQNILIGNYKMDRVFVYCKLAMNYLKLGQRDKAQMNFKHAKNLDPKHSMVCCYYVYRSFFDSDYTSAMQYCKTYNTMHFQYADANRAELWFMWALSYKYRTNKINVTDELDYLSNPKIEYYKHYDQLVQERNKKMVLNRIKSATTINFDSFILPATSQRKFQRSRTLKSYKSDETNNEFKIKSNEVFRDNYFTRCLINACKENPYNYRILIYSINYALNNNTDILYTIIKANTFRLFKDFKNKKATKDFLTKISNNLHMYPDLQNEINSLILEIHGYTAEITMNKIISLIKDGEHDEADELIRVLNIQAYDEALFYYFEGLKIENKYGEINSVALELFEKSFHLNQNNKTVIKYIIEYYTRRRTVNKIIEIYEKAIKVPDVDMCVIYDYAVFLFHYNKPEQSIPLFNKVFENKVSYKKLDYYREKLMITAVEKNHINIF